MKKEELPFEQWALLSWYPKFIPRGAFRKLTCEQSDWL